MSEKLKKLKVTQKATKARYGGHQIIAWNFPHRKYTKAEVEKIIKIQQDKYKGQDLMFMPSLGLQRGYRSMKSFSVNTPNVHVDLYGEESDEIDGLTIYVWKASNKRGGEDKELNDCLFWALVKAINKSEFKTSWDEPWKLKKRLGLERDEMVDIDLIPKIEKGLKVNIGIIHIHHQISILKQQI
jgi:hypothetical protein